MDLKTVLHSLKNLLAQEGIEYALIGGLAVGGHGYERFTNDIDILVHEDCKEKLKKLLLAKGYTLFSENAEFVQFQGDCPIDVQLARRPFSQKMLKDAIILPVLGVKCLRAEDIIGLKIQAYANNPKREFKEKADIQALIESGLQQLDWQRIKDYADLFGQWQEILAIKAKVNHDSI